MELIIIKLLYNYNIYTKYINIINIDFIKESSRELERLFTTLVNFHEKYKGKGIASTDEFEVYYFSLYPPVNKKDREVMEPIFRRLQNTTVTEETAEDYFKTLSERSAASSLAMKAIRVSEGNLDFGELLKGIQDLEKISTSDTGEEDEFVVDDPEMGRPAQGIRWPIQCLNRMLGSLRKGNFGFVFARPETGKTTFLADFVRFAVSQVGDRPILWFNNEQPGLEVLHRVMQSYFGIDNNQFYSKKKEYNERFYKETKGLIKIVDDATISKKKVEALCQKYNPALILFDQIDKIRGFADDRNDLELKAIYQWARELSKRYGPTIGVCQAGSTGEGKKWLQMDDVDGSKTAKQGEADWILGIGKSNQEGMGNIRHFHLCKNKLLGDEDTDPSQRHGKTDVRINANIGRYEDIN